MTPNSAIAQRRAALEPAVFEEPYRLVDFEQCTATIAQLCLRPPAAALDYRPGQYVLLEDRHHEVPPRSYSIANAPRPNGSISMLVTRVPGGQTSNWIHTLRVGDDVSLSGPYGTFVDEPGSSAPALFLAAGSGLAPIRALIEAALQADNNRSLTLILSARTDAEVVDRVRLGNWQARHPNFRFIPGPLPSRYDGLEDHDVFIAGPPGFVADCAVAAETLGARSARIHTEAFSAEPLTA